MALAPGLSGQLQVRILPGGRLLETQNDFRKVVVNLPETEKNTVPAKPDPDVKTSETADGRTLHDPIADLSSEQIDALAKDTQNSLSKTLTVNSIIKREINKNDLIGMTVEAIHANITPSIKLSYPTTEEESKRQMLEQVREQIEAFNRMIDLGSLVRSAVAATYTEGTLICYLRKAANQYVVDCYPLGLCEIGDYAAGRERVVLFNIGELKNRLQRMREKTRQSGAIPSDDMSAEVKQNYPTEVYEAFAADEPYAVLNSRWTGVMKINSLSGAYGLSPIFRALNSVLMLRAFDRADKAASQAKSKKIIHQKLRPETGGPDHNKKGFDEMAYAHENLMKAWTLPTVVVTTPWFVESINYVEPKAELTGVDTINHYRLRILSTLGIGVRMDSGCQPAPPASISVEQLVRVISRIAEQLEKILLRFYKEYLTDLGLDPDFCPAVKVVEAEQLSYNLRRELSASLYTLFNGSLETSLGLLGIDVEEEASKRRSENDRKLSEIFFPRNPSVPSAGPESPVNSE